MLRIKKVRYIYFKELLHALYGHFLYLPFIFMMQFLWKYVDEMVGKGLEMNVLAQFFFLFGADAGAGFIAFGYFAGSSYHFLAILESGLNCLP